MSSTMGSSLLHLLRILTPFEVGRLTSALIEKQNRAEPAVESVAENLVTETALQDSTVEVQGQAKILAFNETEATPISESTIAQQEAVVSVEKHNQFLAKLGIKKKTKKLFKKVVGGEDFEDEEEENQKPKVEEVSTTVFLLQEKEKIKKSQLKLVGQNALKTYRTQAAIDTSHEDKEDLSQSSSSGILVNKRQF